MAIDSREARQSIAHVGMYFAPGVTTESLKDEEWRIEVAYGYPLASIEKPGEDMDWFTTGTQVVGSSGVQGY